MGEGMARRTQQHEGSHEEESELADPPHGRHLISPQVAWSSSATDAWTTPEKLSPNDVEIKLGEPAYCVFPWSSTIFPARSTFMLKGEPRGLAERSFRIRSMLPGAPMGTPSTVRMMSPPTASGWPLMLAMVSPPSSPMFHAEEPLATVFTRKAGGSGTLKIAASSPVNMVPSMPLQNELLGGVDGDHEAEPFAPPGLRDVVADDADHLARHVEHGAARVARVDGGGRLEELGEGHVLVHGVGR